jgi:S-phase kinase-associated protein 1
MSDNDMITLQSQDGQEFQVLLKTAQMSTTIKNLIEDIGAETVIPLPNISTKILTKFMEYFNYHAQEHEEEETKVWNTEFCKVDQPMLFEMILAANYLDMKDLLDLTCDTVANMVKGKTPDEIRKTFNITHDFTPEEEEQVRKDNEWCEEKA